VTTSTAPTTSDDHHATLRGKTFLVKYGGAAMEDPAVREAVCAEVASLCHAGVQLVVVHGGGKEISKMMERLGLTPQFIGGLRVTDPQAMSITEMVLTGAVNSDLVSRITRHGAPAVGLSGRDANLLRAKKLYGKAGEDLGLTGEVERTDLTAVKALLRAGLVPVISPIGEAENGSALNLNADYAAAAIAGALAVDACVFLTDVAGVKKDGSVLPELSKADIERLIGDGTISGGMIPKVECVIKAITAGCPRAIICDAGRPATITSALVAEPGCGTMVVA
jgi:acetylglutamate kinase